MDRIIASALGAWTTGVVFFAIVLCFLWDIQSTLNSVEKLLDEIRRNMAEFRERTAGIEAKSDYLYSGLTRLSRAAE